MPEVFTILEAERRSSAASIFCFFTPNTTASAGTGPRVRDHFLALEVIEGGKNTDGASTQVSCV